MTSEKWIQEVTTSLLAIVALLGTFAIISYELVESRPITLPDIVIAYGFSIIAYYFGRVASQNGARVSGVAAAQTAVDKYVSASGGSTNGPGIPSNPQ